jgi:hypothetical protein
MTEEDIKSEPWPNYDHYKLIKTKKFTVGNFSQKQAARWNTGAEFQRTRW